MKRNILVLAFIVVSLLFAACSEFDPFPFEDVKYTEWNFVPDETVSFEGKMYLGYGRIWIVTPEKNSYFFPISDFQHLLANDLILNPYCVGRIRKGNIPAKVNVNATPTGTRLEIITESEVVEHCAYDIQFPNLVPTKKENPVSKLFRGKARLEKWDKYLAVYLQAEDGPVYAFLYWDMDQLDLEYLEDTKNNRISMFDDWKKFHESMLVLNNLLIERGDDYFNASILLITSIEENSSLHRYMMIQSSDSVLKDLIAEIR